MRVRKDLEDINSAGERHFGYVDMTRFECPPFVMFTNNNDCGICDFQLAGKTFEPQSTWIWSRLISSASSVLDIGAHNGVYSLIAAALRTDIPIIACEPNPDGYARLTVNATANGAGNLTPLRKAVGSKPGYVNFAWRPKFLGQISSGGNLQSGRRNDLKIGEYQTVVEMTTLEILMEEFPLGPHPLVKIDVEGAELLVFKGMGCFLDRKPDILLETFDPVACNLINQMTRPFAYKFYRIDESERKLLACDQIMPRSRNDSSGYNYLLTVRNDHDLQ